MLTAAASFQIGRNVLASQYPGQVVQAFPTALIVGIQDEKPCSVLLVKKICAQGDLTSQVIKQVAHVQGFVDAAALHKHNDVVAVGQNTPRF